LRKRFAPSGPAKTFRGSSGSSGVNTLKTELSSSRKFPFGVVLLKISE
jgi:hypothetical protein